MTTSPASGQTLGATHSENNVMKKVNGEVKANGVGGHEALDLAETSKPQVNERGETIRADNERQRVERRARFEESMRQLEADHRAEESQFSGPKTAGPTPQKSTSTSPTVNGNVSAPTTPPGRPPAGAVPTAQGAGADLPAPIGQGREMANGAKSMPTSRRASGFGPTFGMEKLSLSVMESAQGKGWDDDEVDTEGAQNSVKYLGMNDDDPFPAMQKKDPKNLSAASAALDLAALSQTPPRAYGSRPFETSLKTSDWPAFPAPQVTSPLPSSRVEESILGTSRKTSPTGLGMADSVASLPAMPSKSVPGTPFGLAPGQHPRTTGVRRSETSPSLNEGLNAGQRGFSNPDLVKSFGRGGGSFHAEQPRAYSGDPLYTSMFAPVSAPLPPSAAVAAAFQPQGYEYGYDDDGYGSGALYPGAVGLKTKRADTEREFNRFSGVRLEDLQPDILKLCKDQHGCRYLQKKLEEGDPAHRDMIFNGTYGHFPELMTDAFGNYLCQKLLEYSTEEQCSTIIDSVAGDLVGISLNMHGTRAVQKMVDFLAVPRQQKQIRTLIYALSMNVVALIKDLNGNHVIQKCLNKLIPEDNQFIYNAIAANLIEVATHRHGCCVLQRSIDHASPAQRVQLVTEIIFNSLFLVQDPFGNYVIQYILDLNDARFSEPLIRTFIGNVCSLSVQKFSSNVVEKCIRVADPEVRKTLVAEVLHRSRLEKLLRDSYGNYVIQTILDYCEVAQRMLLIETIRPILPSIRNTPYGKRIQSKLAREDASFAQYGSGGGGGGGGGYGGRGGYRGGGGGGGGGGYQRHLGRPQLQHINALTEVYGSQGPFVPQHNQFMPNHQHHPSLGSLNSLGGPGVPGGPGGPGQFRDMPGQGPTHTGVAYHAPGPDGQPWLHLRGPGQGGPAPNWAAAGAAQGQEGMGMMPMMQDGGMPGTGPNGLGGSNGLASDGLSPNGTGPGSESTGLGQGQDPGMGHGHGHPGMWAHDPFAQYGQQAGVQMM